MCLKNSKVDPERSFFKFSKKEFESIERYFDTYFRIFECVKVVTRMYKDIAIRSRFFVEQLM